MSAALAGFTRRHDDTTDTALWRELCQQLAEDLRGEPYLHVMFAYAVEDDWKVVLEDQEIALRERVAVAVRVLEDEEVSVEDLRVEGSGKGDDRIFEQDIDERPLYLVLCLTTQLTIYL